MLDKCLDNCSGNSHKRFIEEKIPEWLIQAPPHRRLALSHARIAIPEWYRAASPASHAALAQAIKASWLSQTKLDRVFEELADVSQFAEPLLRKALMERFGVELDVNRTCLRLYLPKGIVVGYEIKTLSLLNAALHNFEKKESAENYFDSASCFISEPDNFGRFDVLPVNDRISIGAFVSMCRELDVGGQYSQQLETLLLPKDALAKAVLELKVNNSQKNAFRAAVLLAQMKGDIGAGSRAALLRLLDGIRSPELQCHQLQIMTVRLTGIMVLAGDLERSSSVEPLVVYIPDDPQHPLKEYPSTLAFAAQLTEQLRSPAYQSFFARFVAHEQRGHFFATLDQHLHVVRWHPPQPNDSQPAWRRAPVENPDLRFHSHRIQGDPWQWLYEDKLNKILNDARIIAVPTADEDRESRWALWDSLERVASIVLQVATLVAMPFVPFLGELMLAYTAYQLMDETFTGILDWAEGQVAEAADQLLAIAENLAQLAAFGVAGAVAGRLVAIKPSAFIEGLKPVVLDEGRTRLWNPDLKPYEQLTLLPAAGAPDELGLHHRAGKTYLPLENRLYEVSVEAETDAYQVRHPQRSNTYRPRLTHNGAGAWAHEVERPMEWQGAKLFRRLGHSVADFSDETVRRIFAVSGIDEAVLRHLHVHARRPPALLEDTIRRFKVDQRIQKFRAQLASLDPAAYSKADRVLQLHLLKTQQVSLPEGRLRDGNVIEVVLEELTESAQKKLLGLSPAPGDTLPGMPVRAALLRERMSYWAKEFRGQLFTLLEESFESGADSVTKQMRKVFPDLPRTVAEELLREASAAEQFHLLNRPGMPHRMAHEVLVYLRELRLNRAYEGIYLDVPSSMDTDRLALHMLERLDGWAIDVRLEVRDASVEGVLLDSVGPTDAPIRKVLVRREGRYETYDEHGEQLHGLDDLYGAVQHALPLARRQALGFAHVGQGRELAQALRRQPLLLRPELRTLLGQASLEEAGVRSPMGLAVGRAGYLLGGGDSNPLDGGSIPQRLRALYTTLSDADIETLRLERLGPNPLVGMASLEHEHLRLITDLETWISDVPLLHPVDGVALSAEALKVQRQRRVLFTQEVKASWRRQLTDNNRFDTRRFFARLEILGSLPELSADFSHITEFVLINTSSHLKTAHFLANFPNLQFLTMRGASLDAFPGETFRMRKLLVLNLENCNLHLDEASVEGLAHMDGLEELDLRNNPLGLAPYVGHMKVLEELRLGHTHLKEVPGGLFDLEKLRYADLTGNKIVELPDELFEVDDVRKVVYNFGDNPLSESSKQRIAVYEERSSIDRQLLIQFDHDGEDFSSSDQGSDSESDDSGVGSPGEESDADD